MAVLPGKILQNLTMKLPSPKMKKKHQINPTSEDRSSAAAKAPAWERKAMLE